MTKRIKRKGRFWVYIVECNDGTYYTGYTPNIERRIKLHNSGRGAKYTRDRRPVELVWSKEYKYFKSAFLEEKRIKRLERKEKEGLVRQGINIVYALFACAFASCIFGFCFECHALTQYLQSSDIYGLRSVRHMPVIAS